MWPNSLELFSGRRAVLLIVECLPFPHVSDDPRGDAECPNHGPVVFLLSHSIKCTCTQQSSSCPRGCCWVVQRPRCPALLHVDACRRWLCCRRHRVRRNVRSRHCFIRRIHAPSSAAASPAVRLSASNPRCIPASELVVISVFSRSQHASVWFLAAASMRAALQPGILQCSRALQGLTS